MNLFKEILRPILSSEKCIVKNVIFHMSFQDSSGDAIIKYTGIGE